MHAETSNTVGCSYCGKRFPDLLRCSRCKEVYYCSKDCQRGHWKAGHRGQCVALDSHEKQGNICSFCGEEPPDLLRCSRCKEVYYCSKVCQRSHWRKEHREQCTEAACPAKNNSSDSSCGFCSMKSNYLKMCSGCKAVSYCSKECQKLDWKRGHRSNCAMAGNKERQSLSGVPEERNFREDEMNPMPTDPERCSRCEIVCELKVCKRCEKQKYCSVACQKADWKNHKVRCFKEQEKSKVKNNEEERELLPICAFCRNKKTSLACPGCTSVYYCSEPCQKLDWTKHKAFCRVKKLQPNIRETLNNEQCSMLGLVTPEEHKGKNPNDGSLQPIAVLNQRSNCRQCQKKSVEISCSQCETAMYCSIACRDLHKTVHQEFCTFLQEQSHQEKTSEKPDNSSSFESTLSFKIEYSPYQGVMSFGMNTLDDGADLGLVIERSEQSRRIAMIKTRHKFPNHSQIVRIREIPIEEKSLFASNICRQPLVFLSYIRRFHQYRGCHNVYLQDSERREIYVSFYLPNDDPSPHFRWSDLVPGKFITILSPCIHYFKDGTVGLRVDKASNVYCFDVKD